MGAGIGVSQGNVSNYEHGQTVPPEVANRLITYARSLGHVITFNDVYGQSQIDPAIPPQIDETPPSTRRATDALPPEAPARPRRRLPGGKNVTSLTDQPATFEKQRP
jgi:hypothetical protein